MKANDYVILPQNNAYFT